MYRTGDFQWNLYLSIQSMLCHCHPHKATSGHAPLQRIIKWKGKTHSYLLSLPLQCTIVYFTRSTTQNLLSTRLLETPQKTECLLSYLQKHKKNEFNGHKLVRFLENQQIHKPTQALVAFTISSLRNKILIILN